MGRLYETNPKFGQLEQEGGRTHLQGVRPLQTLGMGPSIRHPLPTALSSGSESGTSAGDAPSDDESDGSEVNPRLNRLDRGDPEEGDDIKYIRAVRAKVTPAVEEHPS